MPVQPPEAVQLVAPEDDHESFVVPPEVTVVGVAESDNVGPALVTVTVLETVMTGAPPFRQPSE